MRKESSGDILNRLRAARDAAPSGVVAFDGDGTLWQGDVGDDLLAAVLAANAVGALAGERLAEVARAHHVDVDGAPDAVAVARRILHAYEGGEFPEETMYEVTAWLLAGDLRADVDAFAQATIEAGGLGARLHREAICVLEWAWSEGVPAYLVSASPRHVVEAAAAVVGVDVGQVVAVTPRYDGERMLPDVERPIPYGPGKVSTLRAVIGDRPLLAAFGDNAFDVWMLRDARIPVAIRPKSRLRARTHEIDGIVEMVAE